MGYEEDIKIDNKNKIFDLETRLNKLEQKNMDNIQKILKQILKEQKGFKKALKMQDKKIDAQGGKFQTALDAQGGRFQKTIVEQRKEFQMYIGVIAEDFESKGNYSASSPL